jgi:LuxR family maltose regulon positive regulatory protein
LAQNQLEAAHELLDKLEQTAHQQGRLGSLISIYLLQAMTDQALNQFAIRDPLREALVLGAQLGFRRTFLTEIEALTPQIIRRRHAAPEFVDSLLESIPETAPIPMPPAVPLGKTQLVILRLVVDGLSNQQIADQLGITVGTTKWHLNQIYQILSVSSRTQAIAEAHRLNLL